MIRFRKAKAADAKMLLRWRNDKDARRNSLNTKKIGWHEHHKWFAGKLKDRSCYIYIVLKGRQRAIGQLRFDVNEKKIALVSIVLDKKFRGLGYGAMALHMACRRMIDKKLARKIMAYIKKNNRDSLRSFLAAGFRTLRTRKIHSFQCYVCCFKP